MVNPRKLAAIDLIFIGWKFVCAEFAVAVVFCPALGVLVLMRRQVFWQLGLGVYLISLGINYVPMLLYAISLARNGTAAAEMGDELDDKKQAMAKYRRQSLSLLVPLLVPVVAVVQERRRAARERPNETGSTRAGPI